MAQDVTAKQQGFLQRCITQAQNFVTAYNALRQLRAEYTSENYSTIPQGVMDGTSLTPPAPTVPTKHLTPAILTNLMSTFDAIDQHINSNNQVGLTASVGYLTNLYNVLG